MVFRFWLIAAATTSVNCATLAGGNITGPEVRWTFKTKGNVIGGVSAYGPVVGGDTVFVAYPNQLYAVNIATGVERWKFGPADGSICEYPGGRGCLCTIPALSVDGATVIVGSLDSILYAVDTTTGVLQWSFRANQTAYQQVDTCASPVFGADNGVFYGTFAGYLHALDAGTGVERWRFEAKHRETDSGGLSTPALSPNGKTVYVGTAFTSRNYRPWSNSFYAVDTASGRQRWRFFIGITPSSSGVTGGANRAAPAVSLNGDTIYFGSNDYLNFRPYYGGFIHALDAATGRQQWVANMCISPTEGYLPPGTTPAVTDDTIFLGSCALNAATGAVRWLQRDLGSRADSTVVLSQDRSTVYVPTDDGNLTALAAATGVVKWGLNLQVGVDVGPPSGPAVSADGTLFVGTRYNCGNYMECDGDLLAITAP